VLRGLFSDSWFLVSPSVLKISVRRLGHLTCVHPDPDRFAEPTLDQLRRLDRFAVQLPGMLEEWRLASIEVVNAEAARRELEIAASVTRLRQMIEARRRRDEEREASRAAARLQRKAEAAARRRG
jgi:hypothetical protein